MADLLVVDHFSAGYGDALVLREINFTLQAGQAVALLGRNGTGKTTLINSLMGLTRHRGGSIAFAGSEVTRLRPEQRALLGLGWVPQERNIFKSLTVEENLTAVQRPGPWTPARVYALFPRLEERRGNMGNQLSGGEQQMLALGRALMLNPRLLLLDEPLEGLAPIIVDELLKAVERLVREDGLAAIIAEQSAKRVLRISDEALILDRGAVLHRGTSAALLADDEAMGRLLGVTRSP